MRDRKKWIWTGFLFLTFASFVLPVFAKTEKETRHHFSTGKIDLSMEIEEEDVPCLLPGAIHNRQIRIENEGEDCFVRIKTVVEKIPGIEVITEESMRKWEEKPDGYAYREMELKKGECIKLDQKILVSPDLSPQYSEKEFTAEITLHGIQSRNFQQDLDSELPWGQVEIIASDAKGDVITGEARKKELVHMELKYEGDSEKLFLNQEDFFATWPAVMPGDVYEERVTLFNEDKTKTALYLTSQTEHASLLEKISLWIKLEQAGEIKTLYEGDLCGEILKDGMLLSALEPGEKGELIIEIEVPPQLTNEYQLENHEVVWIFSAESEKERMGVRTGDHSHPGLYLLIMLLLLFAGWKYSGFVCFKVVSGSMEPAIPTGSICIVNKKSAYEDLVPGDTIVFRLANHKMATHRVLRITEEGIETKGDANAFSDGISTTPDNYVGKVVKVMPKIIPWTGGNMKISKWIIGVLCLVALVALLPPVHAYFTDREEAKNQMTMGENVIEVEEEFEPPIPGEKTVKEPVAVNTGSVDCYVRGKFLISDSRMDDKIVVLNEKKSQTGRWIRGKDNWLYYSLILGPGEKTEPLFTHIQLAEETKLSEQACNLSVYFESVQSDGFQSPMEAFAAIS